MTIWFISGALGFVSGGAAIWFGKDAITKAVIGVNAFSKQLETKLAVIKATL